MMDIPELRSGFMAKGTVEREESAASSSSGEGFGETLSQVSRTGEGLPESMSSPEDGPGQLGTADPEMVPEGKVDSVFSAVEDSAVRQGLLLSGAGAYRRGVPGEGDSPGKDLREGFRQLALSARAFDAKACSLSGRGMPGQGNGSEENPDSEPSGEGPGVFGTEGTALLAVCASVSGMPVDGTVPVQASPLPDEEGIFQPGPERGDGLSWLPADGILKGKQGVSGGGTWTPSSPEPLKAEGLPDAEMAALSAESVTDKQMASTGSGMESLAERGSGVPQDSAVAFPIPLPEEEALRGGTSPAGAELTEVGETFSLTGETRGGQDPLRAVSPKEAGIRESGPADGNFVPGQVLSETGSGPVLPEQDAGKDLASGGNPDVPLTNGRPSPSGNPGLNVMENRDEVAREAGENLTVRPETLLSHSLGVNPMDGLPSEVPGGEVLLGARGAEAMARGLAETVHVVRKRDGHRGTIEVSPPNLGQVRITVESSGDSVQIHLRVESVQVRDMLDQTADVLKQAMEDQGLSLTGMSVDVGGDDNSRGWKSAPEPFAGSPDGDVISEDEAEEVIARLDLERGMLHWVA